MSNYNTSSFWQKLIWNYFRTYPFPTSPSRPCCLKSLIVCGQNCEWNCEQNCERNYGHIVKNFVQIMNKLYPDCQGTLPLKKHRKSAKLPWHHNIKPSFRLFVFLSRHFSGQMSEGSQVSEVTLCVQILECHWLSQWFSDQRIGRHDICQNSYHAWRQVGTMYKAVKNRYQI